MSVEIASSRRSVVAEGPHWDEKSGTLLYVDARSGDICRYDPNLKEDLKVLHFGDVIGNIVTYTSNANAAVIGLGRKIEKVDLQSGKTSTLAEVKNSDIDVRINDGKCDPKGRYWTGTMPTKFDSIADFPDAKGSLYSFEKGTLKEQVTRVGLSNGLAWTSDIKTMYFADSIQARSIFAFDYDNEIGTISNRRTVVDFNTRQEFMELGVPDGMTIDVEDKLWVACFGAWVVLRIDPETGKILQKIRFPASNITSCCFGGPNYSDLYVTSAYIRLTEAERADQSAAGAVFKVSGLPAKGLPPFTFAG